MNTPDAKRFFTDLYHDLQDRHLTLPVLLLAVGILAVPFLIGGSAAETVPPPAVAPAPLGDDATAVESAVLAEDPGIRDYAERLEELKQKNPFIQQFAGPETDPTAEAEGLLGGSTETEVPGSTAVPGGTTDPAAVPPGTDTGTDTAPLPDTGGETVPTDPTQAPEPETETRFYAPRVDVTFGELGNTKEIDDIRYFEFLPDEKTPVVAFLGLGETAQKAVFAVSNEVVETRGEGSCAPHNAQGCELLTMHIGQERTLKLVDGTTYRMKIRDTHFERIPDPREDPESGEAGGKTPPVITERG